MQVRSGAIGAAIGDVVASRALGLEDALALGRVSSSKRRTEVKHLFFGFATATAVGNSNAIGVLGAHLLAQGGRFSLLFTMMAFATVAEHDG